MHRVPIRLFVCLLVFFASLLQLTRSTPADEPKELRIRGRVVTKEGEPAVGTKVALQHVVERKPILVSSETGPDGRYELVIPYGTVYSAIRFQHSDGTLSFQAVSFIDDEGKTKTSDGVFEQTETKLAEPRVMIVTVVDGQSNPVADAAVIVQAAYQECARSMTDKKGEAKLAVPADAVISTIGALKPSIGTDYRTFEQPEPGLNQTHPGKLPQDHALPIELVLDGIHPCQVQVIDENRKPIEGISIRPWLISRPERGDDWNLGSFDDFWRVTNEDGIASFDMLPHDQVNLIQFWPGILHDDVYALGNGDNSIRDERAVIKMGGEPLATITMHKFMQINGTTNLPDGTPVSGVSVQAHGGFPNSNWFSTTTKSDEQGNWTLRIKPDGYYLLCIRDTKYSAKSFDGIILRKDQKTPSFDFELVPAKRIFGRLTGKFDPKTYVMYQQKAKNYYDIPEIERLPQDPDNRRAVSAFFQGGMIVSPNGEFEFFVGEGDFIMWNPSGGTEAFHLSKEDAGKEFVFRIDQPLKIKTTITILDDKTLTPIPLVKVSGSSTDFKNHSYIKGVSNANGVLQVQRSNCEHVVIATTNDNKLGGFAKLPAEEEEAEIYLSPMVRAFGILVDKGGKPQPNVELSYGIDIKDGSLSTRLNSMTTTTDDDGKFELSGLVSNTEHTVSVIVEKDKDGNARSWRILKSFLATEEAQIGILTYSK